MTGGMGFRACSARRQSDARRCPLWVRSGHGAIKLRCPLYPRKRTFAHAIRMSASLIGSLGSSAFRLSTAAVLTSLAGSCFSTESAPRALPSWDPRTRWNNLCRGLAAAVGRSKRTCELTSSIVPRGTPFHRWWSSSFLLSHLIPNGRSCCSSFSGPSELSAINPDAVHDHGQALS